MITTFDAAKCQQRNRIAARRDGAEGMPMRLFSQSPANPAHLLATAEDRLLYAQGTLPSSVDEALARINALLPDGADPLTADAVYIHYLEAANDNFVADRYMFMTDRTLRNIAKDANSGVAFMNSHRDGGLSHPAELPMGKTFAGRYEQTVDGRKRALLGFYMLRGLYPNGQNAPSTDDLHQTIVGGTTADASVGLYGGDKICDVCGNDLTDHKACTHSPGTHYNLTPDQRKAQAARGVTKGRASYSLDDAHMGEVSAVYDGAVPGAGFNKTLALARRHQLSRADLLEASQVYARLLKQGDLPMDEIGELIESRTGNALAHFFGRGKQRAAPRVAGEDGLTELQPLVLQESTVETERLTQKEAELAERERLQAERERTFAQQQHWARAEQDVAALIHDGFVRPAQNQLNPAGQPELTAVLAAVLGQDSGLYTRLLACYRADTARPINTEAIRVVVLPSDPGTPTKTMAPARKRKLLAFAGAPIQGETTDAD